MNAFLVVAALLLAILLVVLWRRQVVLRREAFIRNFTLPHGLFERLTKRHPTLTLKQCQLVAHGLRQFFLAYLKSGRQFVSMPSQVADDLWHEFILFTKHYEMFCRHAFGGFMHHTPAVVLGSERRRQRRRLRRRGLRRRRLIVRRRRAPQRYTSPDRRHAIRERRRGTRDNRRSNALRSTRSPGRTVANRVNTSANFTTCCATGRRLSP